MIRDMIKIDEDKCNGCGVCIPSCHEGALQIIDGKARLISDLMCDGLGACLNHCPQDAMTIEKREAEPYDEIKVMEIMVDKGINTVIAHLKHLKDHNEFTFLKQAVNWLKENETNLEFPLNDVIKEVHGHKPEATQAEQAKPSVLEMGHAGGGCPGSTPRVIERPSVATAGGGCPGSAPKTIERPTFAAAAVNNGDAPSQLRQWPVQMHLINPMMPSFRDSDMVLAADCVAFAMGNFHSKFLKGKSVGIACPKLDSQQDSYLDKLISLIDNAKINTLTVAIMQVPCCGGLLQLAKTAVEQASRKIPVKVAIVSIEGEILSEEWV
ncbi:4Fe-4S binding protein [Carboxylicivirga sp. A043]|uniref:ATP-binding protein n=1 Tax=Carboxylicivirga litoralis TaxID=2816963 RepID=UPI0021CAEA08|nr:4Fe-4S binding protein [Carboxylicivirga sp. A043]MCU4157514.1 4Fe-4S binding protein [Carboxylicivirga sp. A043]